MRIVKYNLEMNIDGINTLVREKSANYPAMKYTDSPLKIAMMCNDVFHLNRLSDEHCILLALNAKCKPIGLFELSHGSISASIVQSREIFARLLLCNSSQFVIVHNHPSGDCTPSQADEVVYRRLIEAGELMNLPCIDSIVVGEDECYSFSEKQKIGIL